jgi:hypothetical protein
MPVYQGACNRPYTVIGKLTVNRRRGDIVQEGVVNEARRYGAQALIVVSSQTITDGNCGYEHDERLNLPRWIFWNRFRRVENS